MANETTYDDIQITDEINNNSSIIAASAKAVKSAYETTQTSIANTANDLNNKITSRLDVKTITKLADLTAKTTTNGWYSITTTLAGVNSSWVIAKLGTLYIATSTTDPRIVLNSINPTNTNEWYSPYGSWHV